MSALLRFTLKNILSVVLVIGAIVAFYGLNRDRIIDLASYYLPCRWPISYTIGSFDTRFGISQDELLDALIRAEYIWEASIGKDLFTYRVDGFLPVHLIYDERQAASLESERLSVRIDTGREAYDSARHTYESLRVEYEMALDEYTSLVSAFESRSGTYERDVRTVNKKGGASRAEFERLELERTALVAMQSELEQARQALNLLADQLNTEVSRVNALAENVNEYVREYNSGEFVGREFEEGLFVRDAQGSRILIYEFSSSEELVRVLTHEFGHALGLPHNENPESVMYPINQGDSLSLSADDISALRLRCGVE